MIISIVMILSSWMSQWAGDTIRTMNNHPIPPFPLVFSSYLLYQSFPYGIFIARFQWSLVLLWFLIIVYDYFNDLYHWSLFYRWISPYKPSSYWGTPICGNPHMVFSSQDFEMIISIVVILSSWMSQWAGDTIRTMNNHPIPPFPLVFSSYLLYQSFPYGIFIARFRDDHEYCYGFWSLFMLISMIITIDHPFIDGFSMT